MDVTSMNSDAAVGEEDTTTRGRLWESQQGRRSTKSKIKMWEAGSAIPEEIMPQVVSQSPETVGTDESSKEASKPLKSEMNVLKEDADDIGEGDGAVEKDPTGSEQVEDADNATDAVQAGGDGDANDGVQAGENSYANDGVHAGENGYANDDVQAGDGGDANDGEEAEVDDDVVENETRQDAVDDVAENNVQSRTIAPQTPPSQNQEAKDKSRGSSEVHEGEPENNHNIHTLAIAFLLAVILALIVVVVILFVRDNDNGDRAAPLATPTIVPNKLVPTLPPTKKFEERPVVWTQQGQTIFGNQENDALGGRVSISSDGTRVAASTSISSTNLPYSRVMELTVANQHLAIMGVHSVNETWTSMGDDFINATFIAMDGTGDRIAVGYGGGKDNATNDEGSVSIYDWNGRAWRLAANIVTTFSGWGASIALSTDGRRVAIGDPKINQGTGLVNVFDLFGSSWIQVGYTLVGEDLGDEFGGAITMSGDGRRIAIGAPQSKGGSGYVKLFECEDGDLEWKQVGETLTGGNGQDTDNGDHRVGFSLAMSRDGSTLVVGSYVSDLTTGGAKVYLLNDYLSIAGWDALGGEVLGAVEVLDAEASSSYGWSSVAVSANGDRVAVGDSNVALNGEGHVEVFDWTGSRWIHLIPDVEGKDDMEKFGASVGLSDDGETMIIGASSAGCSTEDVSDCGVFLVYQFAEPSMMPTDEPSAKPTATPTARPTTNVTPLPTFPTDMRWTQRGDFIVGEKRGDRLGERLAVSSDGLRIVASTGGYDSPYTSIFEWVPELEIWSRMGNEDFEESTLGVLDGDGDRVAVGYGFESVDIFAWIDMEWTKLGNLETDFSSWTGLALSDDGNRVVVGNPRHNFDMGQVNVYDWDGTSWNQVGTSLLGDEVGDLFGGSLAMSGDGTKILIGAPESDGLYEGEGSVKVFEWDILTLDWIQLGDTVNGDEAIEFFGRDVDMTNDGNMFVVGAYESGNKRGGAKVFSWNFVSRTWEMMGEELLGNEVDDFFGWTVAISATGLRVAIGSPMNDGAGTDAGLVEVYDWTGSEWMRQEQVVRGERSDDHMGASVTLSDDGRTMIVGAPGMDCSAGLDCGEVRVYKLSPFLVTQAPIAPTKTPVEPSAAPSAAPSFLEWTTLGEDIIGGEANDALGAVGSISSDGLRIAAGAKNPLNPYSLILEWTGQEWSQLGNNFERATRIAMDKDGKRIAVRYEGNVEIFDWDRDEWKSVGGLITSFSTDGGSLGLSSDGKVVIIGDPEFNSGQGRVYVSKKEGSSWTQVGDTLFGDSVGDEFGGSLAVSENGSRIVIGAPKSNSQNEGRVMAFELDKDEWVQMGQAQTGDDVLDYYGGAVAISHDGNTFAVGAHGAAAARGTVVVYTWNDDDKEWNQLGNKINGDDVSDNFGWSVDLSADGRRLIIGSPSSDNSGTAAGTGLVRVYDWNGSVWVQKGSDIIGGGYSYRLGESVSITGDGEAIFVGGSGADCTDGKFYCGLVQVYRFS